MRFIQLTHSYTLVSPKSRGFSTRRGPRKQRPFHRYLCSLSLSLQYSSSFFTAATLARVAWLQQHESAKKGAELQQRPRERRDKEINGEKEKRRERECVAKKGRSKNVIYLLALSLFFRNEDDLIYSRASAGSCIDGLAWFELIYARWVLGLSGSMIIMIMVRKKGGNEGAGKCEVIDSEEDVSIF